MANIKKIKLVDNTEYDIVDASATHIQTVTLAQWNLLTPEQQASGDYVVTGITTSPLDASLIPYDNTSSGLTADDVQEAIDEVYGTFGTLDSVITGSPSSSKTLTAFSETDGVVTATFSDISITKSQVSDFPVSESAVSGGTTLSLVTTGEKYNWNNKPTTVSGLTDTTISSPQMYDRLTYENSKWVNEGSVYIRNGEHLSLANANGFTVLDAYNSGGGYVSMNNGTSNTIILKGSDGTITCSTINGKAYPNVVAASRQCSFTTSTTLSYTGYSVSCPAGYRKVVRAYFRYIHGAPVETAVVRNTTTVGSYYSECIAYGINGASVCLTFFLSGGETVYYWAKYSNASSNRFDEDTLTYTI